MKTLSQIFRIAQQFHEHHNGVDPSCLNAAFMCWAVSSAQVHGLITLEEENEATKYTSTLLKTTAKAVGARTGITLSSILRNGADSMVEARQQVVQLWEAVITKMEQQEEQPMIKIRHYRNVDIVSFNYATLATETKNNNMGGATIAFQELGDGTVKLGLSVCVENFSRKTGIDYAKRRLIAMPIIVDADELSDIHTLQDLLFSGLGEKLQELYREKGVHVDLYKAYLAAL